MYGLLADLVVALHVAYVGFVVLGLAAVVLGRVLGWGWVRNPWFRCLHLLLIGVVAVEAVLVIECPLTVWERDLRAWAGQPVSGDSFVARLMHVVLFFDAPAWVFTALHIGFALLVLSTFWLVPVRWRRPTPEGMSPAEGGG